ncbi:MAG: hypothetical protein HY293_04640 [Planctomycetes bacterium]|nr:hypothetical protein [Planctomycetota bacterium]
MTEYKNEYQKFADSAVRARAEEEGFGRLRLGVFLGVVGPLAIFLLKMLDMLPPHRYLAMAIVASAPLAVILLIVNFIRLPNEFKASAKALLIGFMTLMGAGATIALARYFELFKTISP